MSRAAPGDLELLRAFVNTLDAETGEDELRAPKDLAGWLAGHGLLDGPTRPADLRRALALREALRATLRTHHGEPADPGAAAVLDDAARRAGLALRFDATGAARVEPAAPGVDGALGRLLAIVKAAQDDRTWARLKVCPAEDCQWAFYDASRNRSARWCTMDVCGNRTKVRRYRERRAQT